MNIINPNAKSRMGSNLPSLNDIQWLCLLVCHAITSEIRHNSTLVNSIQIPFQEGFGARVDKCMFLIKTYTSANHLMFVYYTRFKTSFLVFMSCQLYHLQKRHDKMSNFHYYYSFTRQKLTVELRYFSTYF